VRAASVTAYEANDVPFVELARALSPGADPRRPKVFQVMFELGNTPERAGLALPGISVRPLDFEHGTSEFELNMVLADDANGVAGWLLYRTDLFERATAERLARHYVRAAAWIATDPSVRVGDLLARLEVTGP
jgi:non-ribosomal peptide synthetase component F